MGIPWDPLIFLGSIRSARFFSLLSALGWRPKDLRSPAQGGDSGGWAAPSTQRPSWCGQEFARARLTHTCEPAEQSIVVWLHSLFFGRPVLVVEFGLVAHHRVEDSACERERRRLPVFRVSRQVVRSRLATVRLLDAGFEVAPRLPRPTGNGSFDHLPW